MYRYLLLTSIGFLLILLSCSPLQNRVSSVIIPSGSWERKVCQATYAFKKELKFKSSTSWKILYSYGQLGDNTINQIRCLVAANFNYEFLDQQVFKTKTLTFYDESVHSGLIYKFDRSGDLLVIVVSHLSDNSYLLRRYVYKGPANEIVKIFDRGSVYLPYDYNISLTEEVVSRRKASFIYFTEGGFEL